MIDKDRQFFLDASQRHRDATLTDEKWPGWKFIQNALQRRLVRNRSEMDAGFLWLIDGQGTGGVAADMPKETDDILGGYLEALPDFSKMKFGQQVGEPGKEFVRSHRS
ncbi:hypothetical protein MOV66_28010 [Agrobacterium sp. SHOUNA12C]|uniref:hypothetical protein n=1 Tax=Rhizobium rhizogenes TaxID=359 RepID=UPI001F38B0C8|nr:hypothetical protein [Rhizobium rhizogenes]MCJ9720519.1 hypothetical protein [Agrobacterium sp. BETTINA12B]MCJ9760514.1 hypothetical protein [Agrobacterium sp. SHOUNA12C]